MTPRERILAALHHQPVDRVPRFEIWIDALLDELGQSDPAAAYANLGQDAIMLPSCQPPGSRAWRDGIDAWGRRWRNGVYVDGAVDTVEDLARYSPPLDRAAAHFDPGQTSAVRDAFPDHALIFGTHVGPFTASYMAMGFERFFTRMVEDPAFVHQLLHARTDWCIALYQEAIRHGAEIAVLGDDAGHNGGPMISPAAWRALILPYHRRIVEALAVPVIWHSDGNIERLLPAAVEAGFVGIHGLDPVAGMDLGKIKHIYGETLTLIGNVDIRVLFTPNLDAVRVEVDRCLTQGAPGGGYMLASCNSIAAGMHPDAVAEFFSYQQHGV